MSYGPFGDRAHITFAVSFAIVALTAIAVSATGSLPGDDLAAGIAADLRADWLTDVMRALTDAGAGIVVAVILVFAALGLAANRKWVELGVTVAGALVIAIGVPELKEGIARPRPEDGLLTPESLSFPSGHAAQATVYVYLAFLIAHLTPSTPHIRLIVWAASVFAIGIGLSRIYLGAHYLSDVVAGFAFGAAAFTLWAVVSLAKGRLRENLKSD